MLPCSVRQRVAQHLAERPPGRSILEISHRSSDYESVHHSARQLCRQLYRVPGDMEILLLQGGASLQFAMVPMNLLRDGRSADYIDTGSWSRKAIAEAHNLGKQARIAGSGAANGYAGIPPQANLALSPDAEYVHLTSNNTIIGTQFGKFPETASVPIAADVTSDMFSRPLCWDGVGVAYGGTQKNVGIAGCTVVFIRGDLLARESASVATMLRYSTHVKSQSLYNTPPVFAVYVLELMLQWLAQMGGLEAIAAQNCRKAAAVYRAIDTMPDIYRGLAERDSRSTMNATFDLTTAQSSRQFLAAAEAAGFIGLEGHRSVGGLRASLYNGMPEEGALALAEFMRDFACQTG